MSNPPGRPAKVPEDRKTERVVVTFTSHQLRVLDALVTERNYREQEEETRQDLIRRLVRNEYAERVKYGMPTVKRKDT